MLGEPGAMPFTTGWGTGVVWPATIETVAGVMVTLDGSELTKETVTPPAGAGTGSVIGKGADWPTLTITPDGNPIGPALELDAKYAEISRIRWVGELANALIDPLVVGIMAMFEVIAPSSAFSVEASGLVCPWGQSVKKPRPPGGTTVVLKTCACASTGIPQALAETATSNEVMVEPESRVSFTRHGATGNKDNPPAPGGAKYPFTSITTSVVLVANKSTPPFVPAGTIAALLTTVPVGAFKVDTSGWGWPVGHAARNPRAPLGTTAKFNE
jgi:hypothetical protein